MVLRSSHGLTFCAGWALAAVTALAASTTPAWSEPVQIRAAKHDNFGRLMFFWPAPVTYETAGNDDRLILQFQRPINADYDPAHEALGSYLGVVEAAADGRSVVIPLRDGVTARSYAMDNAVVVDLSKGPQAAAHVELETAAASDPPTPLEPTVVGVRTGEHPGFSRIVFDWPTRVDYQVRRSGTSTSITFDYPARVDLSRLQRRPLKYVKKGASQSTGGTATVTLSVPKTSKARHFRVGTKVVVDVVGSDAAAAKTPVPPDAKMVEAGSGPPKSPPPSDPPAQSADKRTPQSADKQTPQSAGKQTPQSAGKQTPQSAGKQTPQSAGKQTPQSAGKQTPQSAGKQTPQSAGKQTPQSAGKQTPQSAGKQTPQSAGKQTPQSAGKQTPQSAGKQTPQSAGKQTPQSAGKQTPQSAGKQASETASEPAEPAKPKALPADAAATHIPPPLASDPERPETEAAQSADLHFDWDQPVGAAIFRRAGSLWVVLNSPIVQDVGVPAGSETTIGTIQRIPAQRAAALRLSTPEAINPLVERDGLSWILRFAEQPLAARDGIEARVETDENGAVRLFLPIPEPGDPIAVTDPEVGDNLIVVPVIPLGHGVSRTYTYPQLQLLVTAQGVVIQPFVDNLRVRSLPDGIEISADGDLSISPVSKETQAGARVGSPKDLTSLLALEPWVGADTVPFGTRRRALERAVIDAAPPEREQARLDFARFFLSHTYASEAFGALTLTAQHRPEIENQPEFRAMRGVSQLLLGRGNEARDDLFHPSLNGNDEAALWRAAVEATEGQFSQAAVNFNGTVAITRTYPKALRTKLNLLLAEAAIAADQADQANDLMELLEADVSTTSENSWLEYLRGRYLEAIGDYAGALETWSRVAAGPDRQSGAKASMASVELMLRTGDITNEQAIEALKSLRFVWRGDALEVKILRRLAQLYQEQEDYLAGLRTLRQVAAHFSANRQAPEITKQMSETFERLFLEGHADALPAVSAIALYREFQELTPTGDKGNEMIRKLADRLVDVDLLDDAAALLEKQVRYRLTGVEKAKVGARLALVHNLNRKPQAAMDALHVSATSKLPEDLNRQRGRLAAEALTALGKHQQALAVLGDDDSLEADLIRANVFWTSQDWTNAGQALSRVVGKAGAETGKPLNERQSQLVLNLAVALTLAGDEDGVSRVRKDHGAGMSASPLRDAFHLITGSEPGGDVAERDWSTQVKQAESFQAYLAVYRAQLEYKALSDIN